ncbi:VUT family protein [Dactylosporangium sp. CA-052675]|uniref:VUT family protein n=1 Tax=Dactylosporangium sp. CA-052675 TaxID=3239927 RepID=UPI003D94A295
MVRYLAAFLFVVLVVAANWLTATFGVVAGLVTAGTFAAGLVLLVRDWLQEVGGRWWVVAAIAAGALISVWMSSPALALASGVAFAVSELADFAVYTPLRRRTLAGSMALSNTVGAVVDSLLFLSLAGFPPTQWATQSVIKVAVTLPFIAVVVIGNAVLRNRIRTQRV